MSDESPSGEGLLGTPMRALVFWKLAIVAVVVLWQLTCVQPILRVPQLEPDDFRFVARALGLTPASGLEAGLVENRWDMLPFVDVEGGVRFWRPLLPGSFGLDAAASSGFAESASTSIAPPSPHARFEGVLMTNCLLHLLCCVLAIVVAVRFAGTTLAALVGAVAFACFAPHAEAIWYGSGRNATLLGIGFVSCFLLHTWRPEDSVLRGVRLALAPLMLGFALCCKESALVLLPLLCIHDASRAGADADTDAGEVRPPLWRRALDAVLAARVLWGLYAAVFVIWFTLRALAMQGRDALQLTAPYVHAPWTAEFWPHALTNFLGSVDGFAFATPLAPFLMPWEFAERNSALGATVGVLVLVVLAISSWRSWRGRVLLAFVALSWLPTLPVYVSERYLYLPSFALAALFAHAIVAWTKSPRSFAPAASIALLVALVWGSVGHASMLYRKHEHLGKNPRPAHGVSSALEGVQKGKTRRFGIQRKLPRGAKVLVVDFPGDVIHAQFFEDQLRVTMNDAELDVRILNLLPDSSNTKKPGESIQVERKGKTLTLRGVNRNVLEHQATRRLFPILPLEKGKSRSTRDGSVRLEVLAGEGERASEIRYELSEAFEKATILRFLPPQAHPHFASTPPGVRISAGNFVVE